MTQSQRTLCSLIATLLTAASCAALLWCCLPQPSPVKDATPERLHAQVVHANRGSDETAKADAQPVVFQSANLSDQDRAVLRSLPPMCTQELPGLSALAENARANSNVRRPSSTPGTASESTQVIHDQAIAPVSYQEPITSKHVRSADAKPTSSLPDFFDHSRATSADTPRTIRVDSVEPTTGRAQIQPPTVGDQSAPLPNAASIAKSTDRSFPPSAESSLPNLNLDRLDVQRTIEQYKQAQPASFNDPGWKPHASASASTRTSPTPGSDLDDPHLEIYSRDPFPSAVACAKCHQQIFDEWASSSHAYASISPMFHVFENTINRLAQGTLGYFCYRCHSPVSTTMGLRRDQPIWEGPRVFREGVTCIACHRVKTPYGKVDGERRIEPGDIYEPVYGAGDGHGVAIARKYSEFFKVETDRQKHQGPGQAMHRRAIQFEELSKSSFCMSCHQVAVEPGIKLEVVWDQYRASPAYRDGVTCQDCHMGRVPGVDEGYSVGPGAVVNDRVINPEKKHSNHVFYGPGYSIAHPGLFPQNVDADRWTPPQWLEFDWRAGWGTDAFEDAIADGRIAAYFPPAWQEVDDRYDAREIVDANLKKLHYKKDLRRQLLENGSKVDGPFFNGQPQVGQPLRFRYCITNLNPGHNMPSGSLGAQPQIWVNVVLIDPNGNRIWETGYLDSNGDLADNHSLDVLDRKVPFDTQLVNFQTKFLTTNVKGTDREMYLPVNFDIDQLPFLRPPQQPVSVINHPPFIRMEGHSIPPLGKRNAKFSIPAWRIQQPGTYRLSIRLRSRAEPIYFMRFCNATEEMQRMMNEWICDFHVSTVAFEVR